MLGMINKALVVGSLLTLAVGCSQQQSSTKAPKVERIKSSLARFHDEVTNQPAPAANAPAELSCAEIWTGFVAASPLGLSKTYEATTVTEYLGGEGLPAPETVVETSTDTVTASSDDSVSITYDYFTSADPTVQSETQTLAKSDFFASCEAPVVNAPAAPAPTNVPAPAEPTVEILAQGMGKLTVRAGEFDTDWVQGKITQTGDAAFSATVQEWYLTGTDMLVKSTYEQSQDFGGGISVKSTQTVELINYSAGAQATPAPVAAVPAA